MITYTLCVYDDTAMDNDYLMKVIHVNSFERAEELVKQYSMYRCIVTTDN